MRLLACFFPFLLFGFPALAETTPETPAYWDYGLGIGAVHYEHYPAADQFSDLALPSPTFQYRGKVLRADDRDGAHLYLLKSETFTLELSGAGYPALDSANNRAREGMDNLPWLLALGPQLISRAIPHLELGVGVYQGVSSDFMMTRFAGQIFEVQAQYTWHGPMKAWGFFTEDGTQTQKLSLSFKGASQELQALYYEVPLNKVTAIRPAYEARDGYMSTDLTFYQSLKSGLASINFGASLGLYDQAANRLSPLHKSNANLTGFVTFNYILGGSKRPGIPEEDTSGLIRPRKRLGDSQAQ